MRPPARGSLNLHGDRGPTVAMSDDVWSRHYPGGFFSSTSVRSLPWVIR
jgi:hypothetical protein